MSNFIEDIINEKGFINGIYVPWFHKDWFGFDIGKSVYDGYNKCFFDEQYVEYVFTNCKTIGFDMAKIWLNESFEGMLFDDKGTVTGVEPTYMKNLKKLFSICQKLDLKLSLCLNAHQEMYFDWNKTLYDKYMRFVYVESETEEYIKNWLTPIIRMAEEFDCIPLIDIYAEPEADGGGWNLSRGFSWNTISRFINRVAKAVKDINPRFATTVSSGAATSTLIDGKYNTVDVDYLGADIYSQGDFDTPEKLMITKPFMLGEYGIGSYKDASDKTQVEVIHRFIQNCLNNDVFAAFYWCYGWKCETCDEMHIVNSEGELRPAAAYFHYAQIDRDNKLSGRNGYDIPVLLGINKERKIRFFGTRGAKKYILQSKINGNFLDIAIIEPTDDNDYDFPLILKYDDKSAENNCYRVVSVMDDGSNVVSKEAFVIGEED